MPLGLSVGGVTTWALRLARALADSCRPIGLLVHAEPVGCRRLEAIIPPNVRAFDLSDAGPLESANGDLAPFVSHYRAAAHELGANPRHPATLLCGVLGDCYGIGAAMCLAEPKAVRLVGVVHSDFEYDARLVEHYEAVLAKVVGVSLAVTEKLRTRLPARAQDISYLRHGIEPALCLRTAAPACLRLLYTGRFDHRTKRVGALVEMSRELARRGIAHHLTLVGEGPARDELLSMIDSPDPRAAIQDPKSAAASMPRSLDAPAPAITFLPPQAPHAIADHLARSDIFVLASRYEGLSVSLLEAMASGTVPVIARTRSGASEAVEDGVSGILADIEEHASDEAAGLAMADAVGRALSAGLAQLSLSARARVAEEFSMQAHADAALAVIDAAVKSAPRAWPADRPCAFTARPGSQSSGSVPPEGPHAMAQVLAKLAGRKVVIHGAGRHTLELAHVIADAPAHVVAITDDDEAKHGKQLLGWEIIPARRAHSTGATDVVLSSWMHTESLWNRRAEYELQGLRVHRLYPAA